jgi:phosphohistidine phosphatase
MKLCIVQHAEAKPAEVDPSRGLTPKGVADTRKVAAHLRRIDLEVKHIYHSDKARAYETAAILAEHLKPVKGITKAEGLGPQDDVEIWIERLKLLDEDVMIVGHLPHLRRLAALLLCGDPEKAVLHFRMGGVVCLMRTEDAWSLEWAITPETVL